MDHGNGKYQAPDERLWAHWLYVPRLSSIPTLLSSPISSNNHTTSGPNLLRAFSSDRYVAQRTWNVTLNRLSLSILKTIPRFAAERRKIYSCSINSSVTADGVSFVSSLADLQVRFGSNHLVCLVFPGDIRQSRVQERLQTLGDKLDRVVRRYTPAGEDADSVIQVLTVFATPRLDVEKQKLPAILKPKKSPYGVTGAKSAIDVDMKTDIKYVVIAWDTVFADDKSHHTGDSKTYIGYGIDAGADVGCAVLVRPDQYVAGVWADADIDRLGKRFVDGGVEVC